MYVDVVFEVEVATLAAAAYIFLILILFWCVSEIFNKHYTKFLHLKLNSYFACNLSVLRDIVVGY